jgi:site-specific DNA recombinase
MKRGVIYCRVSTKEQVTSLSLPAQERACRDYCGRNGIEVDRVFIEEGESAKTTDRPELQAMLRYCQQYRKRLHTLVVYAVDRLSRDQYDHQILRRLLAGLGITLRAAAQPIDDTPTGRAMEGMLSVFAQLDNEIKATRVKESMLNALQGGAWCWAAPVGYLHVRSGGSRSLIPDPARAPLVKLAFQEVASGLKTRADVHQLVTERGLRSVRGVPLSRSRFEALLRNPLYISRIIVPRWGVDVKGNFPPLVDDETFWRVQAQLAGEGLTVAAYQRRREDFPLRAFVCCGHCGRPLTSSWSKGKKGTKYPYYHCPAGARCNQSRERAEVLEQKFLDLLSSLRPEPEYLALFRAIVLDLWKARQADVTAHREALERKVRDLRQRRDRLDEAFVYQRTIDQDTYDHMRVKLLEDLTQAEMKLHQTRGAELDVEAALEYAIHLASNAGTLWVQADLEQRQRLQKAIFPEGLHLESGEIRTPVTSGFFSVFGEFAGADSVWYPQRDSNPRCRLERAES